MDEDKLNTYKKALADTIAQLTSKRTELAQQARLTIEHLESSIPELRSQVATLQAQIIELDKIIMHKKKTAELELESCANHYKTLEENLESKYKSKQASLDNLETQLTNKESDLKLRESEVLERTISQNALEVELNNKLAVLSSKEKDFESYKESEFQQLSSDRIKLKTDIDVFNKDRKELQEMSVSVKILKESLVKKLDQADEVIARINEANKILSDANAVKDANAIERSQLNELKIKCIADSKKNMLKSESLDERERKLNERQKNIEIAEGNLVRS